MSSPYLYQSLNNIGITHFNYLAGIGKTGYEKKREKKKEKKKKTAKTASNRENPRHP